MAYVFVAETRSDSLLRITTCRLVFQHQRYGKQHREFLTQGAVDQRRRRSGRAAQTGDNNIRVHDEPHE